MPPSKSPTLGARLAELRAAKGLSQYRLAKLLGVQQSTVLRVEAGQDPRWDLVRRWVAALGVGLDEVDLPSTAE